VDAGGCDAFVSAAEAAIGPAIDAVSTAGNISLIMLIEERLLESAQLFEPKPSPELSLASRNRERQRPPARRTW
jgi:hypothetical protein